MTTHTSRPLVTFALFMALCAGTPAFAQTAQTDGGLHFLEQFAVRLLLRGETTQAQKEFERILSIDPGNETARKYLDDIASHRNMPPAAHDETSGFQRLGAIASDIELLKKEISQYQSDSKTLETAIRLLITENDSLYVVLSKRSRDLADLRSSLQDSSYDKEYAELMKALPPDRVPQRPIPAKEIIPGSYARVVSEAASRNDAAVEELTLDIATTEQQLKDLRNKPNADPQKIKELEKALGEKRTLLIEKTSALLQNKEDLRSLQAELQGMNASLKDTGTRYDEAIRKLDRLNQDIRAELSSKNTTDQGKYRELLGDYTAKIKEIDELKTALLARDTKVTAIRQTMDQRGKNMTDIDVNLAKTQREIERSQALLTDYKKRLAERDAVIARQSSDIAMANKKLTGVDSQVSSIETLLKENDQDIAQLQTGFSRVRKLIQDQKAPAPEPVFTTPSEIDVLKKKVTDLTLALKDKDEETAQARSQMRSAEEDLAKSERDARAKDAEVMDLQEKVAALEKKALALALDNDSLKSAAPKTPEGASATPPKLTPKPFQKKTSEAALLHEILAQRDQTIVDLNKKLLEKSTESRELTAMVNAGKGQAANNESQIREIALLKTSLAEAQNSRCALQTSELDLRERDASIAELKTALAKKSDALDAADKEISLLQEKLSVIGIKQDAIKGVVQKRDDELKKLQDKLAENEKDLKTAAWEHTQFRDLEQTRDILTSKIMACDKKVVQLEKDLTHARGVATKKDILREQLEADVKRLEETLKKKEAEIADLYKRIKDAQK